MKKLIYSLVLLTIMVLPLVSSAELRASELTEEEEGDTDINTDTQKVRTLKIIEESFKYDNNSINELNQKISISTVETCPIGQGWLPLNMIRMWAEGVYYTPNQSLPFPFYSSSSIKHWTGYEFFEKNIEISNIGVLNVTRIPVDYPAPHQGRFDAEPFGAENMNYTFWHTRRESYYVTIKTHRHGRIFLEVENYPCVQQLAMGNSGFRDVFLPRENLNKLKFRFWNFWRYDNYRIDDLDPRVDYIGSEYFAEVTPWLKATDYIIGGGGGGGDSWSPGDGYNPKNPIDKEKGSAIGRGKGGLDDDGNINLDIDLGLNIPVLDTIESKVDKTRNDVLDKIEKSKNETVNKLDETVTIINQKISDTNDDIQERIELLDMKLTGVQEIKSFNRLMSGKSKKIELAFAMGDEALSLEIQQLKNVNGSIQSIPTSGTDFRQTKATTSGYLRTYTYEFTNDSDVPEALIITVRDPRRDNIEVGKTTIVRNEYYFKLVDLDN